MNKEYTRMTEPDEPPLRGVGGRDRAIPATMYLDAPRRSHYRVDGGTARVRPRNMSEGAMGSRDVRAAEAVALAYAFASARGRAYIVEMFPPSVVDLFDAVVAGPEWASAADLPTRALLIARALEVDAALEARYQADVDAGRLGFGAGEGDEADAAVRTVTEALDRRAEAGQRPSRMPRIEPVEAQMPVAAEAPSEAEMAAPRPEDGLLGGEGNLDWLPAAPIAAEAPVAAGAPVAAEAPVAADLTVAAAPDASPAAPDGDIDVDLIATVLNAELDGDRHRIDVQELRRLTVFFDVKASPNAIAAQPANIPVPVRDETIDVEVLLVSSDFAIPPFPQQLRLTRAGVSMNRAVFEITALHAGPSELRVVVQVKGNFLQRLDLSFDVGAVGAPTVQGYGRPAASASALQERVATLQITPDAGGFVIVAPQVSSEPVKVWITQDQLEARIDSVRDALLASVGKDENAFNIDLSEAERDELLRTLAFEGFLLYKAIFAGVNASPQLLRIGEWLRDELGSEVTTLQVASIGFPVPWPLMYLVERFDTPPLTWDNFIGMRHVVEQIPMELSDAVVPDPMIASTPELSVRALYNDDIDAGMPSHPVAAQRAYWEGRGVALTEGTHGDDLTKVGLAPAATDRVLYLYCHAVAKKDPADSYLILTGQQAVTLGYLTAMAPTEDKLSGRPLVFLNACESGELSPNFYDGFVPYFLAKGARGVIGTECKTPGYFASEWAKAFFDELFAGKTLGTVVLELRRRFLAEHNNPYGLLYGVHCDTDTVVAPALVSAAAPAAAAVAPAG